MGPRVVSEYRTLLINVCETSDLTGINEQAKGRLNLYCVSYIYVTVFGVA